MRKPIVFVQLLFTCLVAGVSFSLTANPLISPKALMKHVRFLSSDNLNGRGNGAPGLEKAADYIADQFMAAGLKAAGNDSTWFQPFEIVTGLNVGTENHLVSQVGCQTVTFNLGSTYYPLAATSNDSLETPSARIKNLPLIVAGYGISSQKLEYDDYLGIDVKDKAVIIFTHEPQEHDASSRFNGTRFTRHTLLMEKAMAARSRGARMLIAVSDPTHDHDTGTYESFNKDPQAEDYGIPVLRIKRSRIEPFLRTWNLDSLAKEIDATLIPKSHDLDDATVKYVETLSKKRSIVRNVIGILPGSHQTRGHEAVVVGAHYDHLGFGGRHSMNPDLAGQIHNGADDNASGTAAVIEIGRAASTNTSHFDRTLVFIAFAGEELGLLGSAHYVKNPIVPLEQTVAMINLDMIGRANGKVVVSGLDVSKTLTADFKEAAIMFPNLKTTQFQQGAGVGASDDTSFAVKKIPAIGFFSGFHTDYHRPTDDWDRIDSEGAAQIASLAFQITSRIANRINRPEFVAPAPSHGSSTADSSAGSIGGYGPYFGSIPDMGSSNDGVTFAEIRENSPAWKAGLRGGDTLIAFAGKPIKTLIDFTFALREKSPGDTVEVQVRRDDTIIMATVELTTRP